jgi:hypothetical protein
MKKVTMDELQVAIAEYSKKPSSLRLGQYLMNELMPGEVSSVVYHETDNIKAVDEFVKRFVET